MATKTSPASLLLATSKAMQFTDFSKPFKNEAWVRLRNSTLCLVTLVLLTCLLPVPSLWTALGVVRRGGSVDLFWAICAAELALSTLAALNLVQAAIAIRYPRRPLPPLPSSPATRALSPPGQKKRRTVLSSAVRTPVTSPVGTARTQRAFSSSSSYAVSPVSTPSRTLHYALPGTPSPLGASKGSAPSTPSPSLAAFHGRHPPSLGRAFDGSTLSRLTGDSDDDG